MTMNNDINKTLAERIKQTREAMGMSLNSFSVSTKIQKKYLIWIEEGKYDKLPLGIYAIGFLKRCCRALNLDQEEIINQYKEERNLIKNDIEIVSSGTRSKNQFIKKPVMIITPASVSIFAAVIIFALIFGFFWNQFKFLIAPPNLTLMDPANDFITFDKNLTLKGTTERGVDLTVNGKPLDITKDGKFFDYITLSAGLNLIEFRALNKSGKVNIITRKIILNQ